MKSFIKVQRREYEEPYHTEIEISAGNGEFAGRLAYYCNISGLEQMGCRLEAFPKDVKDEFKYEIGSEKPLDNFAYFLLFRAYVKNSVGHCGLHIRINKNKPLPDIGICEFSISSDAARINELGKLFSKLAKFEVREFYWTPSI